MVVAPWIVFDSVRQRIEPSCRRRSVASGIRVGHVPSSGV